MKSRWLTVALGILAVIILIVRLVPHGRSGTRAGPHPGAQGHAGNAFAALRSMALEGTRANFGLPPAASPTQPFVVVADWGEEQGAVTIVAVADGSASVYGSNGGGSIGGGQAHPSIHDAALKTVEQAAAVLAQMRPTTSYPIAGRGQVTFYAVTDAGVFAATAAQEDVTANRSPFSALGKATQAIVAEYKRFAAP